MVRIRFTYMALTDERQRVMPTAEDRLNGTPLDYKEAVKLSTNTSNPDLIGEVDDKYQYSAHYKNSRVHGWISDDPAVGLWMITPSNEFKNGGPTRQRMHSHTGPTMLNVLSCGHYAGPELGIQFRNGEPWKKVFGPVLVYLNSGDRTSAWLDAKKQMLVEVRKWPYDFPASADHLKSTQRGAVFGQLQVLDRFAQNGTVPASNAHVGLAAPGEAGSWQRESKGYQFWIQADLTGNFMIKNVRPGTYSLYAFVPGFIGDYVYNARVIVESGDLINLSILTYEPPRDGPTLWEIGIPDRTATEYFIPDPDKNLRNYLYDKLSDQKFRQYGLWRRYTELYPDEDLSFTVNQNNYSTDWFFAHVTRKAADNQYLPTTWKINFSLNDVSAMAVYKMRIALASAQAADLEVRVNGQIPDPPLFKTEQIGKENAIARHGVQGLYWLFHIDIPGGKLVTGNNTIFLTQTVAAGPFNGVMYDYIRLEGPAT
uniref:rhamnogalacturonan endolyase n=1 Tax=Kalanchoe fedtschenkoi TaxID=63787 RepID=A0A7N0TMU4_KALFE